jgi:hypothetical protein
MSKELKLMVGDWVFRFGNPSKVNPNTLMSIDVNPAFAGNIQPILLTPEILKKIEGMEKIHSMQYRFGKRLFIIRDGIVFDYASDLSLPHVHTFQHLIRLFAEKEIEIEW